MLTVLIVGVVAFIATMLLGPTLLGAVGIAPSEGLGIDDILVGAIVGLLVYVGLEVL